MPMAADNSVPDFTAFPADIVEFAAICPTAAGVPLDVEGVVKPLDVDEPDEVPDEFCCEDEPEELPDEFCCVVFAL